MTPRLSAGTSISTAAVTSRYEAIETTPAIATAGARSRFASRISSPMVEASSIPTNALHITAKLVVISQVECQVVDDRSEEHTSELQSRVDISYAVFCF